MTGTGARTAALSLLASAVLAAGNGVGIRFSNRELAPLWGAGLRFGLAALVLLAVMLALGLALPRGRALVGVLLYGLLNFGGGFGVFYLALVHMHAGIGAIVLGAVPLATLVLAVLWRQERPRRAAVAGVALAGTGIILLARAPLGQALPAVAVLASLVSVVSLAQATVLVRRFPPTHPVTMNAVGMLAATGPLLAASWLVGESWTLPRAGQTWLALGYLVCAGSVLLFVCFLLMLRHWDASRAAYVFVLSPFGAVLLSAWLDAEPVGPSMVFGGVAVLGGVYLGALRRSSSAVDSAGRPG